MQDQCKRCDRTGLIISDKISVLTECARPLVPWTARQFDCRQTDYTINRAIRKGTHRTMKSTAVPGLVQSIL